MKFYKNKRVLITGNTGFKGSWLSEILLQAGANVAGFSHEPPTEPSLYEQLGHRQRVHQKIADVRNLSAFSDYLNEVDPEVVFHLAAQPLVRDSYRIPVETFETNMMGVVNVLEAARVRDKEITVIVITSDKCYRNLEGGVPFTESDPLGGHDPYSASKAAAEIITESYRRSYFSDDSPVRVASARAGNVIGGGDWSRDRIVPDCALASARNETIEVRNPVATRPWQHVMDALGGYLLLAEKLSGDSRYADAYNFGPESESNRSVRDVVELFIKCWPGEWKDVSDGQALHEAALLHLSIDKAKEKLGWNPIWNFEQAVRQTALWYRHANEADADPARIAELTREQIREFFSLS